MPERTAHQFAGAIASYTARHWAVPYGLKIYTEVHLGTSIIGKRRRVDVLFVRPRDASVVCIEAKYQETRGTTDEKIPYALADLRAAPVRGVLVYGGDGWSDGVIQMLRNAPYTCRFAPDFETLDRSEGTADFDSMLAVLFSEWKTLVDGHREVEWVPRRVSP